VNIPIWAYILIYIFISIFCLALIKVYIYNCNSMEDIPDNDFSFVFFAVVAWPVAIAILCIYCLFWVLWEIIVFIVKLTKENLTDDIRDFLIFIYKKFQQL
jgi:hypothetical protein